MRLDARTEEALHRAKNVVWESHGDDPEVHGTGVGLRRRGGVRTEEPVVVVLVTKKRPEAHLSRARILPKTVDIDGTQWGVDVVEGGPFTAGGAPAAAVTLQVRPGSAR